MNSTTPEVSAGAPRQESDPLRHRAVPLRGRTPLVLTFASAIALAMFVWPLLVVPPEGQGHVGDAPLLFVIIMPVIIGVVIAELSSGGIDAKALAMMGVLAAVGAALRPMGAGMAGIELVYFLLVLAGRVYGPGFGYVLGAVTIFTSALITAGVGPWMPFQMMTAAWIGMGAGLLPWRSLRGRREIALLVVYAVFAAYLFGALMNLWFWPFVLHEGGQLSYVPGAPVLENLHTFFLYNLATSAWGWDTGRAITNAVAIVVVGPAVLLVLRRAARKAAWREPVVFAPGALGGVQPARPEPVDDPPGQV